MMKITKRSIGVRSKAPALPVASTPNTGMAYNRGSGNSDEGFCHHIGSSFQAIPGSLHKTP